MKGDDLMKTIKAFLICTMLFLCSFLFGCQSKTELVQVVAPEVSGKFSFTILKSGQADAIIMETQNHSMIIDCGEQDDGDEVVELLKEKNIINVDYMFITHFDKDHVGGFPEVMENTVASNIYVPDYEGNNDEYNEYIKSVEEKNLDITKVTEDFSFTLDDVLFKVSAPKKKSYLEGDNDFSLVISATHGENTFLFAGDAEADRLKEVISEFGGEFDFLKVPHHGKYNKNTKRFITAVKPKYSVICESEKNPAEDETISILEFVNSSIYRTKDGDVMVSSDGKEIEIKQ